uniref:hypothetical protein n=1 Tax=Pasteurella multocida TaxID=747 RepID=UPI0020769B59|nr:hypothetical protein [Pasteurella multocida]
MKLYKISKTLFFISLFLIIVGTTIFFTINNSMGFIIIPFDLLMTSVLIFFLARFLENGMPLGVAMIFGAFGFMVCMSAVILMM